MKYMMKHKWFFLTVLIFFVIGMIYNSTATKIYLSKSQVAVFRYKIPDPENDSEETKNRWIWIRDGLSLKSALITDELIKGFIETNSYAKELITKAPNSEAGVDMIKQMINVQFTGADENNYIIEVKSPNSQFSKDLNTLVYLRLKYLAVDAAEADFTVLITELERMMNKFTPLSDAYLFYQNKVRRLVFRNTLERTQRERAYQVITMPTENNIPIWPKKGPVLILALFSGIVLGLLIEYILFLTKKTSAKI